MGTPKPQTPPAGDPKPAKKPAKAGASRPSERREHERYDFHKGGVSITIEHPGGGTTHITGFLRNLSAGGLAFLSKGYVHPGSICRVTLPAKDGPAKVVGGTIASCRYVQDSTHEVGVKLDSPIEPAQLLDGSGSDGRSLELSSLKGRVLLVDDSKMDQILLTHHMKPSGAELRIASSMADALKMVAEESFDIVICDPSLSGGADAATAVPGIRKAGFAGPIVVCTAEGDSQKLQSAKEAGAAHVLMKPYEQKALLDLLISLHREVGAVLSARTIYSTLEDTAALEQGLAEFVAFAQQSAEQLEVAARKNDVPAVRSICMHLKGSSVGFGFASVGQAARETAEGLDAAGGKMDAARPRVRHLALLCKSVAVRSKAG